MYSEICVPTEPDSANCVSSRLSIRLNCTELHEQHIFTTQNVNYYYYLSIYLTFFNLPRPATAATATTTTTTTATV